MENSANRHNLDCYQPQENRLHVKLKELENTAFFGDWCLVSERGSAVMWCTGVFLGHWLLLPSCVVIMSLNKQWRSNKN